MKALEPVHRLSNPVVTDLAEAVVSAAWKAPTDQLPEMLAEVAGLEARLRWIAETRARGDKRAAADDDRLWTAKEAAAWAGVDISTVCRWSKGKWKAAVRQLGPGTVRFDQRSLRRLCDRR